MSSGTQTNGLGKLPICFLLLFVAMSYFAQAQTSNPFEIKTRVKKVETAEAKPANAPTETSNPFDLKPRTNPKSTRTTTAQPKKESTPFLKRKKKKGKVSPEKQRSFTFTILVVVLLLLALAMTLLREFIFKAYRAFLNDNLLSQLYREQGFILNGPYLILYGLYFISMGFFGYLALNHFEHLPFDGTWSNLLACIGTVMAIYLFKHLVLRIVGWLFPIKKEISLYNFSIVVFNVIIGLAVIPFSAFMAFGPDDMFRMIFWTAAGFIGIALAFRQLRGLFISGKYLSLYKFHFLLYLCAVEIVPVVVLMKLILSGQGI